MKTKKLHVYLTLFLVIQFMLVKVISHYPSFIERFYSTGIYPFISSFLRILFGWIPFSIGDLLIFFLVFILLRFLFRLIRNKFKNTVPKLLQLGAAFSIVYCCFYLFWGFNYFREPLAKNLSLSTSNYTTEKLNNVTDSIISNLNEIHLKLTLNDTILVINPYSQQEIYLKAVDAYGQLSKTYPQFTYKYPSLKNSLMSLLQTYNGTAGYINPLTGEAQVNKLIPKTGYPVTTCHEIAHQLGWAAENEANFVGFMAATHSNDLYFKYAAYRMAFSYTISELRKRDREQANMLWSKVHKGILKDFQASNAFWQQYENPIEPLVKKGYNSYLKANNQMEGIDSYNYVVDLLIGYFHKH